MCIRQQVRNVGFCSLSLDITLFHREPFFTSGSNSRMASLVCCVSVLCIWVELYLNVSHMLKQCWKGPQMVGMQRVFSRVRATFVQLLWLAMYHQYGFELKIPCMVFTSWSNVEKVLRWLTCSGFSQAEETVVQLWFAILYRCVYVENSSRWFDKSKKQSYSSGLLYIITSTSIMSLCWKNSCHFS